MDMKASGTYMNVKYHLKEKMESYSRGNCQEAPTSEGDPAKRTKQYGPLLWSRGNTVASVFLVEVFSEAFPQL